MRTSIFPGVIGVCLLGLSSAVAADGRIDGRVVVEGESNHLEGARVRLDGVNREVRTARDGRFSFGSVEAGEYTVVVEYLGAAPERRSVTVSDGERVNVEFAMSGAAEEIVVTGMRSGTARALNQQRASDIMVSIVSADDIGALPDANVAEAVQRVPGVFLERDQGEGRFIGIRGLDPNLNTTTINGLLVPAPESGARSVALDVIPSDLLEGLEISKTFTPDMDASAIGGTVNVRALSAFDRPGRSLSLTGEVSYNELVEETSPKVAGTFTDTFELSNGNELGVAFAGSWFDREFGSDNVETDGGWPDDLETSGGQSFKGAEEIEQRSYSIDRERIGVALNFDLQTEGGLYYLRNLYSDFSDQEYRNRNEYKFDDGTAVSAGEQSAVWDNATLEKSMKDRLEEQQILSVLLGGENDFEGWRLDYYYGYSYSEESEPDRLDTAFELEGVQLGYSALGERPDLFAAEPAYDAANYELSEFVHLDGKAEDEAQTLALNLTWDLFDLGYNGDVRFGGLYRTREKTYDVDETVYEGPDDTTLASFSSGSPRYDLGEFGPGVSASGVRRYFDTNRDSLEIDEDGTLVASIGGDYDLNEDVTAAYVMSTLDIGDLHVVYGVRFERTEFDSQGTRILVDDVAGSGDPEPAPVSFSQSYDDWLPSLNLRYTRGDLVFRGAVSRTLARPSFAELAPGGEVEFETDDGENVLSAELGNPELDPVESTNIDFGVEWYPGGVSLVSAGVFYKDIDNFVVIADVGDSIDLSSLVGPVQVDDAEVIQPINGDSAEVFGVEIAALKQFDSGLYVSGNGTYVDTDADYPGRSGNSELPRTPEWVLNGVIGWENRLVSLRAAVTYRDTALLRFEELDDAAFDVYQDEHLQVDLSAKVNVTKTLQIYASAINITDEPFYAYFGSPRFNAQYEEYGRTYSLGLRYTPY